MKYTLLQACKKILHTHDPVDLGWPDGTTPYQVYMQEFGNFHGFTPQAVTSYCQGLPSLFSFPFANYEILDTLAGYGIVRKRDSAIIKLIDDYWGTLGDAAYLILKESMKNETVPRS